MSHNLVDTTSSSRSHDDPPAPSISMGSASTDSILRPCPSQPPQGLTSDVAPSPEAHGEALATASAAENSSEFRTLAAVVEYLQQTGHLDSRLTIPVPARELVDLYQKLHSQPIIDEAKGILMGYYGIDADRAFSTLRRWSQNSNVKVRLVARLLVDAIAGHPSSEVPPHELIERLLNGPGLKH